MKSKHNILNKINTLLDSVHKAYDDYASNLGLEKHYFKIKHEKIFKKLLLTGRKKRYAGYVVYDDNKWLGDLSYIHVAGFESKRSDSSDITVRTQDEMFKDILELDKSSDYVFKKIKQIYKDVCAGNIPVGECVPSPGISKEPEDSKGNTIYYVAARYSNDNLPQVTTFHKGDRVYYVYVKQIPDGYPETSVIGLKQDGDIPEGFVPDWEKIADKAIKEKFQKAFGEALNIPDERFETIGE